MPEMENPRLTQIPELRPEWVEQLPSPPVEEPNLSEDLDKLKYRERLTRVESLEHELTAERQLLGLRKGYATALFILMSVWLIFIGMVLVSSGTGIWCGRQFHLSDAVVVALITTTTINVLGLFYIVAKWLFPNRGGPGSRH
jgi:hypothetical protein